jgi:thiamine biosynthesis lipoprotein
MAPFVSRRPVAAHGLPAGAHRGSDNGGAVGAGLLTARHAEAAITHHAGDGWHHADDVAMGTAIHVELWCTDAPHGRAAAAAVLAEMHRIDAAMSPVKPTSELARINREAHAHAVPLSAEMTALLDRALAFSKLSHGAFDITFAAAGRLYDFREGVAPDDAALAAACPAIDWRALELDTRAGTLRFARPGMRIDLGGFAKGHAVDNAARILTQRFGIRHALISAGGDSRAIGDHRGRPWSIAIRDPRRETEVVAVLPLEDVSISTSGDYERCFVHADGRRVHHILDPRTGRPADAARSVTVLGPDGTTTEALSKTVFVLGVDAGLRIVDDVPGTDAVVVDAQGRLHHSRGLLDGAALAHGSEPACPALAGPHASRSTPCAPCTRRPS